MSRQFSPYEKNQLLQYGITENEARKQGEMPIEYITGHVSFCDLDFLVTKDVLIPRVETEELVSTIVLDVYTTFLANTHHSIQNKTLSIIDIGTGSGAIGISIAHKLLESGVSFSITLLDVSSDALTVAEKNIRQHISEQDEKDIWLLQSDLFSEVKKDLKYDVIVANLPYIPVTKMPLLDSSVKDFEPNIALDGGKDGIEIIAQFFEQASRHIAERGTLYLEVDESHTRSILEPIVENYFDKNSFVLNMYKDQFGRNRFAKIECLV